MALRNCCSFIAKLERRESFGNKKIAGAKCTYNLICQSAHHKRNLERSIKRSENTETNRVDRVFLSCRDFDRVSICSIKKISVHFRWNQSWLGFSLWERRTFWFRRDSFYGFRSFKVLRWFRSVADQNSLYGFDRHEKQYKCKRCRSKFTVRVWIKNSSWKAMQMQALPIKPSLHRFDRQRLHLHCFSWWIFDDDQSIQWILIGNACICIDFRDEILRTIKPL